MTNIYISCDDFCLYCPHCHSLIEEIHINRVWEGLVPCVDCGSEYELDIVVKEA